MVESAQSKLAYRAIRVIIWRSYRIETKMFAAAKILMVVLLLVQATLGICCYAPAACSECRAVMSSLMERRCCSKCEQDNDSTETPVPSCPHGPSAKCHGFCTFLKAEQAEIASPYLALFFIALPAEAASRTSTAVAQHGLEIAGASPPSIRVHAFYQVLLI